MANAPSPDVLAKRRFASAPLVTTLSAGTAVLTGTLSVGVGYSMTASVECFWIMGTAGMSLATASSNPLWAKERADVVAESSGDVRISVYSATAGTHFLTKYE